MSTQQTVILVPGFKGSRLVDGRGRTVWVTAREALFGRRSLGLGLLGDPSPLKLTADGSLDSVPTLPGLPGIDVYGQAARLLQQQLGPDYRVVSLGYDWRQDPIELISEIAGQVEFHAEQSGQKVHVVAHSMGAMLSSWYLRFGRQSIEDATETWSGLEHVASFTSVAGCFRGSAKMFRVMQLGDPAGPNKHLLSARALSSFHSSYYLLPIQSDFVVDAQENVVSDRLLAADYWQGQGWGGFLTAQKNLVGNWLDFKDEKLIQANGFHGKLHSGSQVESPGFPRLQLQGTGQKTLSRVLQSDRGDLALNAGMRAKYPELRDLSLSTDGDGTLTHACTELPAAFLDGQLQAREYPAEHVEIVKHPQTIAAICEFLQSA